MEKTCPSNKATAGNLLMRPRHMEAGVRTAMCVPRLPHFPCDLCLAVGKGRKRPPITHDKYTRRWVHSRGVIRKTCSGARKQQSSFQSTYVPLMATQVAQTWQSEGGTAVP